VGVEFRWQGTVFWLENVAYYSLLSPTTRSRIKKRAIDRVAILKAVPVAWHSPIRLKGTLGHRQSCRVLGVRSEVIRGCTSGQLFVLWKRLTPAKCRLDAMIMCLNPFTSSLILRYSLIQEYQLWPLFPGSESCRGTAGVLIRRPAITIGAQRRENGLHR
jgi:hypothetical protein